MILSGMLSDFLFLHLKPVLKVIAIFQVKKPNMWTLVAPRITLIT